MVVKDLKLSLQSNKRLLLLLKTLILLAIFAVSIGQRLQYFDQVGKDIFAYEKAIQDLFDGVNPYKWTVESFSNPDDLGNHGYAYLPNLMYLNGVLYLFSLIFKIPFQYLWKVPVLLADIGIGLLLIKHFGMKRFLPLVFGLLFWYFNPYFYLKSNYVYFDPIAIFFMLAGLKYLEKDDVLSGSFLALAIGFKTFPVLLVPMFLMKAKNKLEMLASMALIGLFISIPFMTTISDFLIYLQGALFVHQDRFVQGRPFLFYISYFYKIELFQIIPLKFYSTFSFISGWLVSFFVLLKNKKFDKYILASLVLILFYIFTPVLNRTYLIWGMPVFILGFYAISREYKHYLYYFLTLGYWGFYYWYLLQWKDGFHIWRP